MENGKPRNLIPLKEACAKGQFGMTKAYELINEGKIDAFKMEGRVMIDAGSIERYHLSLPKIEPGSLAKRVRPPRRARPAPSA
jgi:hypothetical protein